MAIDNKRSVTINPVGSTKIELRELSAEATSFTRSIFMRDLKRVAAKSPKK